MAQVINTNTLSLTAQNNMNRSQSALGTAIERLSSGLRINSAKDDAAGQAISNRFTANINGLTQASRNANDGISIAQTTEGALNEINDNLQNIRRLAVQAQNGTNSASDRQSIQDEINQRLEEINRISEQTEFNGVKVLSKDQQLSIQVGSNDGQTIDIQLNQMNAETLGMTGFTVSNGVDASSLKNTTTVSVATDYKFDKAAVTDGGGSITAADIMQDKDGNTVIKGSDGKFYDANVDANTGDVSFDSTSDENTTITAAELTSVDGKAITKEVNVDMGSITGTLQADDNGNYYIKDADGKLTEATVTINADGTATATDTGTAVSTEPATDDPLKKIDAALAEVDQMRSGLGAVQNRFDSVINNLNSTVNNLSASRSRILDADYATEVSNMSRAQILQQAGTTVLAQANQVPQNVLSLLR
ncbi:FliC/FljB family flagellin [Enterobacteriaceae bacterium YMB-R22]|jgi:flagellin|uniref:FliC/FljB family flagellin n=1 Tax=Tenebrionicola larvae TaxID=2815733 RepID=UPI002013A29C|nr:FliC/FljB family flagellin [Tenebrionicola larvae]MBV4413970.1 FliC/FljB family flagellin [Tenebrionicola larvae]